MTRPPDLPTRLRLVVTRLARRLRQQAEAQVSPTQAAVLATIDRRGPLTLGELAEAERVQPPTITAAVDRLEQQGLVQRRRDAPDRRVVGVQLTAAGEALLDQTRSRKSAYLEQRLGAVSARDRATLERAASILERILEDEE
ncbi:MAG: MarR family winged helix-turn-helix transcriptional regulator [Acidimicrobiia bacterium]